MISRLLKVTLTEWKLFVTDPAAVLLLVVAGILYAFYYPTAYVNQTVSRVPVAIVDLDHSAKSRELTRMASATQQVEVKGSRSKLRLSIMTFLKLKQRWLVKMFSGLWSFPRTWKRIC